MVDDDRQKGYSSPKKNQFLSNLKKSLLQRLVIEAKCHVLLRLKKENEKENKDSER